MNTDLIVWTGAAKDISTAVNNMITTYRTLKSIKKQEAIVLKEKIRVFQTMTITRGMGEIVRANIEEIAKTNSYITQCNLDGIALDYAMSMLTDLNKMLNKNLEEYMDGF